jgi:hypothetical protein
MSFLDRLDLISRLKNAGKKKKDRGLAAIPLGSFGGSGGYSLADEPVPAPTPPKGKKRPAPQWVIDRVHTLDKFIRSPGFRKKDGSAKFANMDAAKDEMAFLMHELRWLEWESFLDERDVADWHRALDYCQADRDETEAELLETLSKSILQRDYETLPDYIERLRICRKLFATHIRAD